MDLTFFGEASLRRWAAPTGRPRSPQVGAAVGAPRGPRRAGTTCSRRASSRRRRPRPGRRSPSPSRSTDGHGDHGAHGDGADDGHGEHHPPHESRQADPRPDRHPRRASPSSPASPTPRRSARTGRTSRSTSSRAPPRSGRRLPLRRGHRPRAEGDRRRDGRRGGARPPRARGGAHAAGCGPRGAGRGRRTVCYFPAVSHAEFKWSKAAAVAGHRRAPACVVGVGRLRRPLHPARPPPRRAHRARRRLSAPGYLFLANKYYLDALYERVIVRAIAHPIAQAANWVNQNVIDGVVNGAGVAGKQARQRALPRHRPAASSTAPSTAPAPWPTAPARRCARCSPARSTSTAPCSSARRPSAPSCS